MIALTNARDNRLFDFPKRHAIEECKQFEGMLAEPRYESFNTLNIMIQGERKDT